MANLIKKTFLLFALNAIAFSGCSSVKPAQETLSVKSETQWVTDTLYFGLNSPQGLVSYQDWQAFLKAVVTPRFPDGLTVWDAQGQWRDKEGVVEQEPSRVLQLVHPSSPQSETAIYEIIESYKARFHQESVLRIKSKAEVSF